jgi:cytochrome c553
VWRLHGVRGVLVAGALIATAPCVLADARGDYLLHCAGCHLADARGVQPYVPSLAGPLGRLAASAEGRDYIARVPGAAQAPISDDELAAVLNWLLLEYNRGTLPTSFKPLRGAEVAKSRSRVLADPLKLRMELWPDAGTD